jgi:hypothetical protein
MVFTMNQALQRLCFQYSMEIQPGEFPRWFNLIDIKNFKNGITSGA